MGASTKVETQVFRPDPDRPGYLQHVRDRTIGEVLDELRAVVGEYPRGGEEYFSISPALRTTNAWPCPVGGRLVVFAVPGSSEGDYVHVEVHAEGEMTLVLLAKTFHGRDAAWEFARVLADLLQEA